jgi:hypothetical protein
MWKMIFWKRTVERAIKTGAQFALVAVGGDLMDAWTLDPKQVTGAVLAGILVSVLTSVGSAHIGPGDDPSVVE